MYKKVHYDMGTDRFFFGKTRTDTITPVTLCYHIGYKCNLACDYCLTKNNPSHPCETDLRHFLKYIEQWSPLRVVISGGEPLLYMNKLVAVLSELKNKGIITFLSTNGTLIKQEYHRLQGLVDWYDISLPAVDREVYKAVRGSDKFDIVLEGVRLLVRNNERVRLTYTINEKNKDGVLDFPLFAIENNVDNIRIGHTFSNVDGTLNENFWRDEYCDTLSQFQDKITMYPPLSQRLLPLYNRGYLILENDGSLYRGMVRKENYLCHAGEIEKKKEIFAQIGRLQLGLFTEEDYE